MRDRRSRTICVQLAVLLLITLTTTANLQYSGRHHNQHHLPRDDFDDDDPDMNTLTSAHRHWLRWVRVESVKRGILQQLGLTEAPKPPPRHNNHTNSASRLPASPGGGDDDIDDVIDDHHVMAAYQRSLMETASRSRSVHATGNDVTYDDDDDESTAVVPPAKQFYSFKGLIVAGADCSQTNVRPVRFRVEIPEPKEASYETVVTSATLRMRRRRTAAASRTTSNRPRFFRVSIYHVVYDGLPPRRHLDDVVNDTAATPEIVRRHHVTSQTGRIYDDDDDEEEVEMVASGHGRWEEYDVTSAVERQLRTYGGKAGVLDLEVKVVGCDEEGQAVEGLEVGEWCQFEDADEPVDDNERPKRHGHPPLLNVLTRDRPVASHRQSRRSRRSVVPGSSETSNPAGGTETLCTPGDGEDRCCRRSLWISFREIGWDNWIMAPDGYRAYYCEGSCPAGHLPAHNYAAIRQLLLLAGLGGSGGRGAPPIPVPTCSATRLSPLPIAHYLNGRRVVSIFDNMVVDECRCA